MSEPVLVSHEIGVAKGQPTVSFSVDDGLTVLLHERESHATALSLILAGRLRPVSGSVEVDGSILRPRQLYKKVALAGAPEIDTLERATSVRETLREQIAWAQPWWKPVTRQPLTHELVEPWLEPLGLSLEDVPVGALRVIDRIRLRVLLALVARPSASVLIVDDIDQLRSLELRDELLDNLAAVAEFLPVIASSVNPTDYFSIDVRMK